MYAYCSTELVNPASMSFEWEWAHVVWKLVCLRVLTTSRYSLWSCRDEINSFFLRVFPLCWDCLFFPELKTIGMNLIASEAIGTGQHCKWVPYCAPFRSIWICVFNWSLKADTSLSCLPQKCLHDVTMLSWAAQEHRCSFEAQRTCSLSPTKDKIALAESWGNFWKKKQRGRLIGKLIKTVILAVYRSRISLEQSAAVETTQYLYYSQELKVPSLSWSYSLNASKLL